MKAADITQTAKEKEADVVRLRKCGLAWAEIGLHVGTSARYAADLYKRAGYRAKRQEEESSDPLAGLNRRAIGILLNYTNSPHRSATKGEWRDFVLSNPERFDPRSKRKARGLSWGLAGEIARHFGLPCAEKPVAAPRSCPHCGGEI